MVAAAMLTAATARADNVLHVGMGKVDPPTVITLGVQLLVTGDDNFNAQVAMQYRKTGTTAWTQAAPLVRVHPEAVVAYTVPAQFAGSIFELEPATQYDIELHATDPDGNVDQKVDLQAQTRPVPPADPVHMNVVNVTDTASLQQALSQAKAGDVITLAAGTYTGTFSVNASGTAQDPIVVRGANEDTVILDGQDCTGCNEFDVYGSYVNIERMTIQNVERAVRWQTMGATNDVLRRVHAKNTRLGIGGKTGQQSFYVCDNIFEGRLVWPDTYGSDNAAHANDDGLVVQGSGHVVCHNRISGYADSLQNYDLGTRGNDFYGNDSLWNYDDGIELDGTEGNSRAFRNRWTNTYDALSFQPIYGGPAYAIRNVIVNVANEGMKLHALGATGGMPLQVPVGVISMNNTFVAPYHAIQISTPNACLYTWVQNNLFVGPTQPAGAMSPNGRSVEWDTPIDPTTYLDYDGYWSDGNFELGYDMPDYTSFAAMVAAGKYEKHGVLLAGASSFANGLVAPADHMALMQPQDVALSSSTPAIDKGLVVPGLSDVYRGAGPDMGALEVGCPEPIYGPRPDGVDETNEPRGCPMPGGDGGVVSGGDSGVSTDGGGSGSSGGSGGSGSSGGVGDGGGNGASGGSGSSSGCGCRTGDAGAGVLGPWLTASAIALALARRRRKMGL